MTVQDRVSEVAYRSAPIAPLQNGMLFHAVTKPGQGVDVEHIRFDLAEPLDLERFVQSWNEVIASCDVLRTYFQWEQDDAPQRVVLSEAEMNVTVHDWTSYGPLEFEEKYSLLAASDREQGFDLAAQPPQRLHLFERSGSWTGLWSFHHALLDGRSFPLVLGDVFAHYDYGVTPSERPSYDMFVDHLVNTDHSAAMAKWTELLRGMEPAKPIQVHVEPDNNRAAVGTPLGSTVGLAKRILEPAETLRLAEAAASNDVSLNNFLQAAWALLLHRYHSGDQPQCHSGDQPQCHSGDQPQCHSGDQPAPDGPTSSDASVVFGSTRACRHLTPQAADTVGLLINTVPLRVKVDRSDTVAELLQHMGRQQLAIRDIEATPLHLISQAAGIESGSNLFESLVVFDSASLDSRMARLTGDGADKPLPERHFQYQGQTNFPLTLVAYGDEAMSIQLEYALSHLGPAAAQRMLDTLLTILASMAEDQDQLIGDVVYLSSDDRSLLETWNRTEHQWDVGSHQTLSSLLEAQVAKTPDAVALRFGQATLSYQEFNQVVNRLAHHLQARGVKPEIRVGVMAERSLEMLIAIHAIIKAGGAYVPLDPTYPVERLQHMISDSGVEIVITAGGFDRPELDLQIIDLGTSDSPHRSGPDHNPEPLAGPSNGAYVIFTSGSTGKPKGVLIEHHSIVNRLLWMQDAFRLSSDDVVLQKTPYTFDVSVWELFWPLQSGAELAISAPDAHRSPSDLIAEINQYQVTTMHFVPSMLNLFLEDPAVDSCRSLRRVICSGEALPRDLVNRFFTAFTETQLGGPELHNLYGPTEAAVDVTWWPCEPDSPLSYVPIGHAIANTTMHVLDSQAQPVPPGAIGELYIGGTQLAREYLNRPELSAERFVANPHLSPHLGDHETNGDHDRLYRTGDLGRFRSDGSLEYLGRTDHQVKIRGFRIELGEIEAVLGLHPMVSHCVVIDREDRPGNKQIVAYYVPTDKALVAASLRQHLSVSLPDYMIPTAFVALDQLPLSGNGKIDRSRLDPPKAESVADSQLPSSDLERRIAKIWAELLEVDVSTISHAEPFFSAGGHSLLAIRLSARLAKELAVEVSVTDLIDHATVAAQAGLISGSGTALSTATKAGQKRRAAAKRRTRRQIRR